MIHSYTYRERWSVHITEDKDCKYLTDPFAAFTIDWSNLWGSPPKLAASYSLEVPVVREGQLDAVVFWYELQMCKVGLSQSCASPTYV